jgi:hypothetical protein
VAGEVVSLTVLLFHSSVKLKWIASCFMETYLPKITDVFLLKNCACILTQLNVYAFYVL